MPGQTEGRTAGQKEGQTNPILFDPSGYHRESNKTFKINSGKRSFILEIDNEKM